MVRCQESLWAEESSPKWSRWRWTVRPLETRNDSATES